MNADFFINWALKRAMVLINNSSKVIQFTKFENGKKQDLISVALSSKIISDHPLREQRLDREKDLTLRLLEPRRTSRHDTYTPTMSCRLEAMRT